jgi:folate-dependent tRNA-U54 methylase TrmFO/GidA
MALELRFTLHAEEKLSRLSKLGVTMGKVTEIIESPEQIVAGYSGRKIAQGPLTDDLLLRVVYEETGKDVLVITLYPAERGRYK